MVSDSVQRARNAVEEARAVAERSRAKAELMEDRPCPDVSCFPCSLWPGQCASPAPCLPPQIRSHCCVTFTSNVCRQTSQLPVSINRGRHYRGSWVKSDFPGAGPAGLLGQGAVVVGAAPPEAHAHNGVHGSMEREAAGPPGSGGHPSGLVGQPGQTSTPPLSMSLCLLDQPHHDTAACTRSTVMCITRLIWVAIPRAETFCTCGVFLGQSDVLVYRQPMLQVQSQLAVQKFNQ